MTPSPTTPLCEPDYLMPPDRLPPSRAPLWMQLGWVTTLIVLLLVATGTLFGPMDETVVATGIVRSVGRSVVHSGVDAILEEVRVHPGQIVESGAVLVKFDTWEFEKRLARLGAELNEARVALRLAETTQAKIDAVPVPLEFLFSAVEEARQKEIASIRRESTARIEGLHAKGGASILDVLNQRLQLIDTEAALERSEQARALFAGPYGAAARREAAERVAAAQARVEALEAELEIVRAERKGCDVVAPRAGRVLAVTPRLPGERVAVGVPLVRLAEGDAQELRLYATEDRLGSINPGQVVRFQLKRQSDKLARPARAEVSEVAPDRDMSDVPVLASGGGEERGEVEPYRITARVLQTEEPIPLGAEVEAEIVIRREAFWQHMLRRMF